MKSINRVAVFLGAAAGLLSMVFIGLTGLAILWIGTWLGTGSDDTSTWIVLSISLFGGEFVGGYVAGRLVPSYFSGLHGGVTALMGYAVVSFSSLVAGSSPNPLTLAGFALVAAGIGHFAGVWGGRNRDAQPE